MSIEQTLERIANALEAIAGNKTADAAAPVVAEANAPKRGPGRPPKAAAAPATASSSEEPATASNPSVPSTATAAVTKEQTQNALVALIKANKRDTVVKILGEHGAQSVSALAPEHYAAVYAKAVAATPAA